MRFKVLTDNLTDGPKDAAVDFDLEDDAVAVRVQQLIEAGAIEAIPGTGPAKSANKGEWVAWAVLQGADEAEAEAKTKDELIADYGEDA